MSIIVVTPNDGEQSGGGPIRCRIIEDGSHTDQRLGLVEVNVPPGPASPPQHIHRKHDEIFIITKGRLRFTSGDQTVDVGAGSCVTVPPGTPHTFSNPFDEPATFINTLTPDLYVEYFRDLGRLPVDDKGLLSPADIGRTMARYDTEVVPTTSWSHPEGGSRVHPATTTRSRVFQSINGYYWYLRLRGYEIDEIDFGRKSFGNMYALKMQTNGPKELAKLLMKLCEKTGRRLRKAEYAGTGVHVSCVYTDFSFWHTGRKVHVPVYTTREIYLKALWLLKMSGYKKRVRNLAVSVYDLIPHQSEQLEMFTSKSHAVAEATDKINDKYGEFVITPALMMGMDDTIIDRIACGGVKELEELYQQ